MKTQFINGITYGDSLSTAFGGYNNSTRAAEYEFKDMINMSGDKYPWITTREKRTTANGIIPIGVPGKILSVYIHDKPLVIFSTEKRWFYDGSSGTIDKPIKDTYCVPMGAYLIFPNEQTKKVFNTHDKTWSDFKDIETMEGDYQTVFAIPCDEDGKTTLLHTSYPPNNTRAGEVGDLIFYAPDAEHSQLYKCLGNKNWVEVDGCTKISIDRRKEEFTPGTKLKITGTFADAVMGWSYTFDGQTEYEVLLCDGTSFVLKGLFEPFMYQGQYRNDRNGFAQTDFTFETVLPKIDGICSKDNRLWAYNNETKEIMATKLGTYNKWYAYAGISTDSYTATVPSINDFVACCSWNGYVLFFKEDRIVKVSGTKPANYTIVEMVCDGVKKGCENSIQEINGILYYYSPHGMMAYDGSYPTKISNNIIDDWEDVKATSAYNKYYCNVTENGKHINYVYDTKTGMWHKHNEYNAHQIFTYKGEPYEIEEATGTQRQDLTMLTNGTIPVADFGITDPAVTEEDFNYMLETEKMFLGLINRKKCVDIKLRFNNHSGVATVFVSFDGEEDEREVQTIDFMGEQTICIPMDDVYFQYMTVKIVGNGEFDLKALSYSVKEMADV